MPASADQQVQVSRGRFAGRGRIITLLKIGVSVLLILLILQRLSLQELKRQLLHVQPWALALPAGLILFANVLGAVQWGRLLRAAGIVASSPRILSTYFVGLFFNNFLIGSVGGDVYKVYSLGRSAGAMGRVAGATIVDRVLAVSALCALALCAATAGLWQRQVSLRLALVILGFTVTTMAVAAAVLHVRLGARIEVALARLPIGRPAALLAALMGRLREYRERPRAVNGAFLISLCVQAARVMAHFCVALALGWSLVAADIGTFFRIIPALGLISSLPISVGGWGVREWAGVVLFEPLGRGGEEAVALLALTAFLNLVCSLPGGAVLAWPSSGTRNAPAGMQT